MPASRLGDEDRFPTVPAALKSIGLEGFIRALELTHGDHGWHPHTHELWLVKKNADALIMKKEILKRWESACDRAGLLPKGNLDVGPSSASCAISTRATRQLPAGRQFQGNIARLQARGLEAVSVMAT